MQPAEGQQGPSQAVQQRCTWVLTFQLSLQVADTAGTAYLQWSHGDGYKQRVIGPCALMTNLMI